MASCSSALSTVKTFQELQEKLKEMDTGAVLCWGQVMQGVEACGYAEDDYEEFQGHLRLLGRDAFTKSIPCIPSVTPRVRASLMELLQALVASGLCPAEPLTALAQPAVSAPLGQARMANMCVMPVTESRRRSVVRSVGSAGPRRVEIWFRLEQLKSIDLIGQRFEMQFLIRAQWLVDGRDGNCDDVQVTDDDQEWGAKHFKWDPQLKWLNEFEENHHMYREWYSVHCTESNSCDADSRITPRQYREQPRRQVRVVMSRIQSVTFSNKMKLWFFPIDTQRLRMSLRSTWDNTQVLLAYGSPCKSELPKTFSLQDYKISPAVWVDSNNCTESLSDRGLATVSDPSSSTTGKKYSIVHVALYASRNSKHFLYSIVLPQFVLTTAAFATFSMPPEGLGERLHIDMILILTSVSFQSAIQDQIPNVPYLTVLEWYLLINFLFLALVCAEHWYASKFNDDTCGSGFEMTWGCEGLPVMCFSVIWVLVNLISAIQAWRLGRKRRELHQEVESVSSNAEERAPALQGLDSALLPGPRGP